MTVNPYAYWLLYSLLVVSVVLNVLLRRRLDEWRRRAVFWRSCWRAEAERHSDTRVVAFRERVKGQG